MKLHSIPSLFAALALALTPLSLFAEAAETKATTQTAEATASATKETKAASASCEKKAEKKSACCGGAKKSADKE